MAAKVTIRGFGEHDLKEQPAKEYDFEAGIALRRSWIGYEQNCINNRVPMGYIPIPPHKLATQVPGSNPPRYLTVSRCTVTRREGGLAELTVDYVGATDGTSTPNEGLPPDEVWMSRTMESRALELHPKYESVVGDWSNAVHQYRLEDIQTLLKLSVTETTKRDQLKYIYTPGATRSVLDSNGAAVGPAIPYDALVHELFVKLRRGKTSYPIWLPTFNRKSYSWGAPALNGDNRIESPPSAPLAPPPGLTWLRVPDEPRWDGSKWVVESQWFGAPDWDV